MELRQLKTFLTVARLLSFHRAAAHLNYAQSSISAQIQALEENLGVKLFDRLGRRILLTEAGERLLPYAEKVLALVDETRAEITAAHEPQGELTIRVPETFGVFYLPAIIKRFRDRFPRVRLRFITCAVEGLQKDLRKGLTDLAFLLTEAIHAADLQSEVLGFTAIQPVTHPDHPLAGVRTVPLEALNGETLLFSEVDCAYRRSFERILDQKRIRPGAVLEFSSTAAIKQSVRAGIGITILPRIAVADEIARGELCALACADGQMEVAQMMVWYREKWLSPALSAFMEATRDVVGGHTARTSTNPPVGR